ncbi:MAG: NFACT family protein [Candidatus Aenigmarchaeota archaeon]|nr:NFACT family protein [Candidatus Aenigmarchaeota archaeon]
MGLTPIDFHYLALELKVLEGSSIKDIKRSENICIEFKSKGKAQENLVVGKSFCYLTQHACLGEPDGFCNFLMQKIKNLTLLGVRQDRFNKILILSLPGYELVLEFIGKGNIILCDKVFTIITALNTREFRDRKVLPKEKYIFPPSPNLEDFEGIFDEKTLASGLHIGKDYARELSETKTCIRALLERKLSPRIYLGKEPLVSPIELRADGENCSKYPTLSRAIEEAYREKNLTKEEVIKSGRDKSLKKHERETEEYAKSAKAIFENISEIEKALSVWKSEKKITVPLVRVNEKSGEAEFQTEGVSFRINVSKGAKKTMDEYFQKSKKAREKISKTRDWMEKTQSAKAPARFKQAKKQEWFDQFKNFTTSDGFLVIIGKDATTNELLIKKYCKKSDIVLHAHIPGSPFGVIRSEGRTVSKEAIAEAAQFTASNSRFWISRLGVADIYWVTPDQVSKTPRPGEYLTKGSFMIYGKRNFLRVDLGIALGLDENLNVLRGVKKSVERNAKYFVEIVPGSLEGKELGEAIKEELINQAAKGDKEAIKTINPEEFLKIVPYGKGQLAKKTN